MKWFDKEVSKTDRKALLIIDNETYLGCVGALKGGLQLLDSGSNKTGVVRVLRNVLIKQFKHMTSTLVTL